LWRCCCGGRHRLGLLGLGLLGLSLLGLGLPGFGAGAGDQAGEIADDAVHGGGLTGQRLGNRFAFNGVIHVGLAERLDLFERAVHLADSSSLFIGRGGDSRDALADLA